MGYDQREAAIHNAIRGWSATIVDKEPPYADLHVRWCDRSENKSRRNISLFSSYSIIFLNLWTNQIVDEIRYIHKL